MNYAQTIDYLFSTLPMFSNLGKSAIKKDLNNIKALCNHLGHPESAFKTIHVGGTNGKGSVSNMLAAVLQQQGYHTGLYTSPHLFDFRERIRINGVLCTEEFVVDFVQENRGFIEHLRPSFFEITVAMAFQYFSLNQVDVAIIEVGLGGRLDSTNVVVPELSIITNIGLDHTDVLGETLEEIAFEKAGIIKPKVPVVIGDYHPETFPVFERESEKNTAPLTLASAVATVRAISPSESMSEMHCVCKWRDDELLLTAGLTGPHQLQNIRTVIAAIDVLTNNGWDISKTSITEGIRNVKRLTGFWGRMEVLHKQPLVIADVAHNADGMRALLTAINHLQYDHLHFIIGMVKDKDIDAVLSLLPKDATYYYTNANIPRALPAGVLRDSAAKFELNGQIFSDVNYAIQVALKSAQLNDLILIAGSFFLVAEVDVERLQISNEL